MCSLNPKAEICEDLLEHSKAMSSGIQRLVFNEEERQKRGGWAVFEPAAPLFSPLLSPCRQLSVSNIVIGGKPDVIVYLTPRPVGTQSLETYHMLKCPGQKRTCYVIICETQFIQIIFFSTEIFSLLVRAIGNKFEY